MKAYNDYLYNWNTPSQNYHEIQIEDDSLRDGLQGAFLKKPTLSQKLELLELSAAMGVQNAMIGFPGASEIEYQECLWLIQNLDYKKIPLNLYFLARAKLEDLDSIVKLQAETSREIVADFFIGMSPLRCFVEGWHFAQLMKKCEIAADFMNQNKVKFSISLEDVTRSNPNDITSIVNLALEKKTSRITLCDTVGTMIPNGTEALVSYVKQLLSRSVHKTQLGWHGHNDNGLSLANAISAMNGGVDFISGAFAGIGERSGNTALEQVIFFLYQQGNKMYNIDNINHYSQKLSKYTGYEIPVNSPLIGSQIFATSTGTHTSAILKAKNIGIDFEDYIFSSVPASKLHREQEIYINYNSGMSNIKHVLNKLGIETRQENLNFILNHAKKMNRNLKNEEIINLFKGQ